MSLKTLAEAIMLQATEDFLSNGRQEEDVEFFSGEGFRLCSELASMKHAEKCTLLDLIRAAAPAGLSERKKVAAMGNGTVLQI